MAHYSSSSTSVRRAAAPFDNKDANVVLRSSDNVDFGVYKHTIALASPVLNAFIPHSPHSPPPPSASRRHRKRPVVALAEQSETLDMFLRFIYPVSEPTITLDDVATLLKLAEKYDTSSVSSRMRLHLLHSEHLESDPLRVYALASFAGMEDVAQVAARYTLPYPIPSPAKLTELRMLPGSALIPLLDYRRACAEAAVDVARISNDTVPWWIQLQWRRFCFLSECGWECARLPRRSLRWHKTLYECIDVPEYWVEYMNAVGTALGERLDPAVARDPSLVRSAVEEAAQCSRRAVKVHWDMQEFAQILEEAVREAISGVTLGVGSADGYEDDPRALAPYTKTNYLLPCDRLVWPEFDYSFTLYCKRLDHPVDEEELSRTCYGLPVFMHRFLFDLGLSIARSCS